MVDRSATQTIPRAPVAYARTDEQAARDIVEQSLKQLRQDAFLKSVDNADSISEGVTHLFMTPAERAQLSIIVDIITDFEAVGDGTADDTAAFNAFTAWVRALPGGLKPVLKLGNGNNFLVTGSGWDLTQLRINGMTIDFSGSIIIGETAGKPVIDVLDSEHINFVGMSIFGPSSNTPSIGIQWGRGLIGRGGAYITMDGAHTFGEYTVTAALNSASEIFKAEKCDFWNSDDTAGSACYIADGQNATGIASDFFTTTAPANTVISFNDQELINCTFEKIDGTGTGYGYMSYGNAFGHKMRSCYGQNENGALLYFKGTHHGCIYDIHAEAVQLENYAVIDAPDATTTPMHRVEFYEYFLFADDSFLKGIGGTGTVNFYNSKIGIEYADNDVPMVNANGVTFNFHGEVALGDANNAGIYDLTGFTGLRADIFCALSADYLVLPASAQVRTTSASDDLSRYYGAHHIIGSLHLARGADLTVASNVLTIPPGAGTHFHIAGFTGADGDIDEIVIGPYDSGRVVQLSFGYGSATLLNSVANKTFLAGDFAFSANNTIWLRCSGTLWVEICRCANVAA